MLTIGRSLPAGLDRTGFLLSAGCAVHCAAMPFAAGFLSLIGAGFVASPAVEAALLGIAAGVALVSMRGGCRHHRQLRPVVLMVLGFGGILGGQILAEEESVIEILAVAGGALMVAAAHLVNWRLCCAAGHEH
jgi:hypothetical protein